VKLLSYTDFKIVSCQATIFTPDEEFTSAKIMQSFYPRWAELFNVDPVVIPQIPAGLPVEVPRIILQSTSEIWRCEIAPTRMNVFLRQTVQAPETTIELEPFFNQAFNILTNYQQLLDVRIGRLAMVITRFALHDTPGLFLARHFCQDRWNSAPLNRPESFELHAHKRFLLDGSFQVNSWARSKTGHHIQEDQRRPAVIFEEDINTMSEEAATKSFSRDEIRHFLRAASSELDVILQLYYPQESKNR